MGFVDQKSKKLAKNGLSTAEGVGLFPIFATHRKFLSDAIKDMSIHKGDIPAQQGGRLASLLDIRMRDGNMKKEKCSREIIS